MQSRTFLRPMGCATLLAASCFAPLATAQSPSSNPPPSVNDTWLAQTARMYYSSEAAGLKGFDCGVRPDWRALYASQNNGQVSAADEAKITLLSSVRIVFHGRMDSGAIMDWNLPERQLDSDQTALLNQMRDALNQTLQGFMQFWTPFIERQVVPDSSSGLEITTADDGSRKVHLLASNIELFETFDSGSILRQYNVVMTGTKVDLTPTYSPSDHGLLITHFHAFIRPVKEAQKAQEMNVEVGYQWIEGFPIPAHLGMNVEGVAGLNFAFENCTVQH